MPTSKKAAPPKPPAPPPEPPAPPPPPSEPPPPEKKRGIDMKELEEFEDYFRLHEDTSGAHRPDLAIQAGTGLILIEILRSLRGR